MPLLARRHTLRRFFVMPVGNVTVRRGDLITIKLRSVCRYCRVIRTLFGIQCAKGKLIESVPPAIGNKMQYLSLRRCIGVRVIRGVAGLVLAGGYGMALSASMPVPFKVDFRPEFTAVAHVSCPQAGALPRPLIDAVACGDAFRVRARLAEGADVSVTDSRVRYTGRTALHHAAQRADLATVELLLAAGANPDAADAQGNTPLHLLAMRRRSDSEVAVARSLLDAGADGRLRNARGRSAVAELMVFASYSLDPLRISAEPLGAVLDEAEATGPMRARHTTGAAPQAAGEAVEIAAMPVVAVQAGTTASAASATATAVPSSASTVNAEESVRNALQAWAAAWSSRDVDAYLARYASSFKPADGKSIDAWRTQRRQRLGGAASIEVKLSELAVTVEGDRAVAKFQQEYRSDSLQAIDRKTVVLISEAKVWRIIEERSVK
ncbi:L,D-transpeptidase Cds6 family protein [Aromatoleum diolicum]|uniref:Cds6 C-terminal domain-containing protein n=1 Tax=Aromatoleum diolicum TaxID=75796 RepID=A0ABX1QAX4_9RHOO|nr:ankyrin repeat domain-containing protein [Aromatoleum diolicum]NMG75483.1 hypothetical protein [Aromatoleum diolicum]